MSLDLVAIHTALADQIRDGIDDSGAFTVTPFPSTAPAPKIEIHPGDPYVNYFATSGPDGLSDVNLVIEVFLSGANPETEHLQRARLLSSGTGFGSSIVDAVMRDRSLGGTVDDAVTLTASVSPEDGTISIPVAIQAKKVGAEA